MNPESPANRRRALEESLTALILGELPPEHAAALQEVLEHDVELARTHARLKQAIALVQEVESSPATANATAATSLPTELKLSAERRATLLRSFKTITPLPRAEQQRRPRATWLVPVGIAAVLMLTLAALLTPSLSRSKFRSESQARLANRGFDNLAPEEMAMAKLPHRPEPLSTPVPNSSVANAGRVGDSSVLQANDNRATIVLPSGGQPVERFKSMTTRSLSDNVAAGEEKSDGRQEEFSRRRYGLVAPPPAGALGGRSSAPTAGPADGETAATDFRRMIPNQEKMPELGRKDLKPVDDLAGTLERSTGQAAAAPEIALRTELASPSHMKQGGDLLFGQPGGVASAQFRGGGMGGAGDVYSVTVNGYANVPTTNHGVAGAAGFYVEDVGGKRLNAQIELPSAKDKAEPQTLAKSDLPMLAYGGAEKKVDRRTLAQRLEESSLGTKAAEGKSKEVFDFDGGIKVLATEPATAAVPVVPMEKPADAPLSKPSSPPPVPQPEVITRENAFSTFSMNVSDVSFKLAAASLEKGQLPEAASIRSEEFINAFDYRDPEARPGVPVTFAFERSQYPFAQSRDLLRFSVKTAAQGRAAGRPLNLVLLLDNSGSMERADRVAIIREALRVLARQLRPQDILSVVTFARTAQLRVDGVTGAEAARVAGELGNLTPEGGTNLGEALNLAYQTALKHYLAGGVNRVVMLTDGAANLGEVNPDALQAKVEAHRKQGIALDCFGIGWEGYNDDLLEVLTRHGDGRYGFLNTPEEAADRFAGQLAGALQVAAANVKVQVEFNPARVSAYRQIGYARHQLTQQQFRDNTVDAAELGAAESGNALYVIAPLPTGSGPLATVRVRYQVPGTSDYREQEWAVPYDGQALALEAASPAMRLAAVAGTYAEWLAASPFVAEVSSDRLLAFLRGVPKVYGADERPHRLEWMIRQTKSLAGQ